MGTVESHQLQEMKSDIEASPQSYARGPGERKPTWMYMWYEWP